MFRVALGQTGLDFDTLSSPQEIERAAQNYNTALQKAIEAAVPRTQPNKRKTPRGWWSTEHDNMTQAVKCLQARAQKDPANKELASEARMARSSHRNAVREEKQNYLILKLHTTGPREIWKFLKRSQPAHTQAIPDLNGEEEFAGKCDLLRRTLFPPPAAGANIPPLQQPASDLRGEYSHICSREIQRAIDKCNKQSANGYDRIRYIVIEKANKHLPALLTDLFTAPLKTGYIPTVWKHVNCVVMPKGGRRDPSAPKSYRPISLLRNVSRILEKLAASRISRAAIRVKA